jgi:hypothetical protein
LPLTVNSLLPQVAVTARTEATEESVAVGVDSAGSVADGAGVDLEGVPAGVRVAVPVRAGVVPPGAVPTSTRTTRPLSLRLAHRRPSGIYSLVG